MKYHDTFSHVVQLVTIPSKTKKLKTSQILSFTSGPEGASELRVRRARFKSASASMTRTSGKETTDHHLSIILARTSRIRSISASMRRADIIIGTLPLVFGCNKLSAQL